VPTNKEIYNEVELDKVLCVRALAQEEQLIKNIQKIQEIKLKKAKATTSGTYHCYKECDMLHWNLHYCYIPDSKLLSICCSIRHVEGVQNPVSTHCTCRPFLENVIVVLVKLIFFCDAGNCATSLMFHISQSLDHLRERVVSTNGRITCRLLDLITSVHCGDSDKIRRRDVGNINYGRPR
jgi:hypothetical protein